MKVAVCKYPVGEPADFAAFAHKQRRLLDAAAAQGAQVAVLPEYLSLELAATFHKTWPATCTLRWRRSSRCARSGWRCFPTCPARPACTCSPAVSCSPTPMGATATAATCSHPMAATCGRTSCS